MPPCSQPLQPLLEADVLANGTGVRRASKKYGFGRNAIFCHLTRHPTAAWLCAEFLEWTAPGTLTAARARFADPAMKRLQFLALQQSVKDLQFEAAIEAFREDARLTGPNHFADAMKLLDPERMAAAKRIASPFLTGQSRAQASSTGSIYAASGPAL